MSVWCVQSTVPTLVVLCKSCTTCGNELVTLVNDVLTFPSAPKDLFLIV